MADDALFPASSHGGHVSRRAFGALSAMAGLAAAGAATGAVDPKTVVEQDVTIKMADGMCDAALYHPPGKAKTPAVLMVTDILGLRPVFRDMGRRLSAEGYTVLVPNPFYRYKKAPVIDGPFDFNNPTDRAKMADFRKGVDDAAVDRDTAAWLDFLDAQGVVNTKAKAGVQGYCMGGPYAFRTAAGRPARIGAVATFHGGGLVADGPASPHLLIAKTHARYLVCIAANDDQRQPDAKDKLKAAFEAAHLTATVEVFPGANHGWCVKDGAVYNEAAAEKAWAELLQLYKGALV